MKIKIILAENAGFCFGVKRAVDLVDELRKKNDKDIFTVGELIHNQTFIERLNRKNIFSIEESHLFETIQINHDNDYVIRAHGVKKEINKAV